MSVYRAKPARRGVPRTLAEQSKEQLAAVLRKNAGASAYRNRDPIYALSESFGQVFDYVGRQRAQAQAGLEVEDARGTDMLPWITDDKGRFLRRFAAYAFQNGRLASAILQGQGALALHACIARAAGMAGLTRTEQRRRIDKTADRRRVPYTDDWVHFGGDAHAAVALVTSSLRTARGVLLDLRRAAAQLEGEGNETLRELFPFLFDEEDRALIERLSRRRRELQERGATAADAYRAVSLALTKAGGVQAKKAQMRKDFLNRMDQLLSNARAAERLFASEPFRKRMQYDLFEAEADTPTPPEGEEDRIGKELGDGANKGGQSP